jgi:hypothetical protein
MEEEMFPDTEITALPAFAHNRFGIRHELAFKLCVCWIAAMTYISTVRLNDPQYEANLLITSTYTLNNRVYRAFVVALGVKYAAIAELMRFVWHSDNFCSVHQRDATITIYAHWVQKIHTLLNEDLEGAYLQLEVRQKCQPRSAKWLDSSFHLFTGLSGSFWSRKSCDP